MNPMERCLVVLGDIANTIDELMAKPMEKVIGALGHDYDTPWEPTVEDDQGEALEPEPAVVDALRPDTQDRQWRSSTGSLWKFEEGRWFRRGPEDYHPWLPTPFDFIPTTSGPFTEMRPTVEDDQGEALEPEPLTWEGWCTPAILEVLSEYRYSANYTDPNDWANWAEDIAPLLAERIACDPERALDALTTLRNDRLHE